MNLTIVHLSDIHFTTGKNSIEPKLNSLAAAIQSTDPGCSAYAIVLSGDIAHGGLIDEYKVALSFFARLRDLILKEGSTAMVEYVTVPGNHDCYLPAEDTNLRETLVKALTPWLQRATLDNSILESVLAPQAAYFAFCGELGVPTMSGTGRLYEQREVRIGSAKLCFNLYNTALLSTRDEQQGSLVVPMEVIRSGSSSRSTADLNIAVLHHPYPWLQADNGIALRDHIEHTSEVVLTGHQHFDSAYLKQPLQNESILYSEGDILQDGKKSPLSGFRLIQLDTEAHVRRIVNYDWVDSYYKRTSETAWEPYSRATTFLSHPTPVPSYTDRLSDPGIPLVHPAQGVVPLEAIFVYPDLFVSPLSSGSSQRTIKGDGVFKYFSEQPRLVVRGADFSGKSSLAKSLVKDWIRTRSFYPLLLNGKHVKYDDITHIERLINASVVDSYGNESSDKYQQLSVSAKAIVIDDWDDSPLTHGQRDRFLGAIDHYFGKIVLFVRGMSYIQYLLTAVKGTEAILDFELVSLKELSHVARGEIIEKWLGLGMSKNDEGFSRRVEATERLVQSLIGKNTLPSIPLIVLAILQASERNTEVLPENGSFGYLYEVLITSALSATEATKPQLDKKYTFLSLLAFHFFEIGTDLLPAKEMDLLLDDYSTRYRVRVDKAALMSDLERARILVKQDGNYSFGYSHYFYYFLARHFKHHIASSDSARLRGTLTSLAAGLNSATNSIFLMFFIYLTHDEQLIHECVSMGKRILAEIPQSTLGEEVEFYNNKDFAGFERHAPESIDLEASRRRRREAADSASQGQISDVQRLGLSLSLDSTGYSDDLPIPTKLDYAFRCIELLGQILRNFTGSLPGDTKLSILETTYCLGLRALRVILMSLSDATRRAKDDLAKRDESQSAEREVMKHVEKLLTIVGQLLGAAFIKTISINIGSPDIDESAYADTLERVGRNDATALLDLAIRLDHFEDYPFNQIKALYKQYDDNRFARNVLRDLVIDNMHVFNLGREMRARVLAVLGTKLTGEEAVSRTTKRLK